MRTEFEESGDVRDVDLLAAFVALWRSASAGALRFTRGTASAGFDVTDGDVVAVVSSEPRFETAAILVRAGKLEAGALERLSIPPGGDAALAAMGAGILTRREWKWGEKIRAIEVLSDLLGWPEGRYRFDSSARPAPGEFTLTIPRLLLELFLRSRDRNLIEHQLGPTDLPLVRTDDFESQFPTFGLTADAESVVRLIDGRATAVEIAHKAPAEEFAVLKLLAALKTLGLLETAAEEPALAESSVSGAEGLREPEPDRAAELEPVPEEVEAAPEPEPEPVRVFGETDAELPEAGAAELADQRFEESDWESPSSSEAPAPPEPDLGRQDVPLSPAPWTEIGLDAGPPPVSGNEAAPTPEDELEARRSELFDARLSSEETAGGAAEPPGEWPATEARAGGVPEPLADAPATRSGPGLVLTTVVLLLGAAIAGVLLVRSRSAAPATTPSSAAPTSSAAAEATAPAKAAPRAAQPSAVPAARPAPTRPPAAAAPRPAAAAEAPRAARDWARRAERDRARLAADRRTRYAVQLELACEDASLVEAWKYDRPAGSLWLLPAAHGGRSCYRVLWGRYPSLAAALAAKSGIPSYFSTATNHPAVVSVR